MNTAKSLLLCGLLLLASIERANATAPPGGPTCFPICPTTIKAVPARDGQRKKSSGTAPAGSSSLAGGSLTLRGRLAGNWDQVDGNIVFTYDFTPIAPDVGPLQVLVRGLPAIQAGADEYTVQWDRSAYWLDVDGNGAGVPRMLATLQLENQYVPLASNDPYPEFAEDPAVVAGCTASTPCTIQLVEFTLYREPDVDYSDYPDLAASADLLFVASPLGQAIAAVVDVYDQDYQYVETKDLVAGDELQTFVIGYRLAEPDSVYLIEHMDFVVLQPELRIELGNHIPSVDFPDPMLPPDLNAGNRRMKLLMDAYRDDNGTFSFAFGGPFDQGFTWRDALNFLFRNSFETLQPAPTAAPELVKQGR